LKPEYPINLTDGYIKKQYILVEGVFMERRQIDRRLCYRKSLPFTPTVIVDDGTESCCVIKDLSFVGFCIETSVIELFIDKIYTLLVPLEEKKHYLKVKVVWLQNEDKKTKAGLVLKEFSRTWVDFISNIAFLFESDTK